MSFANWLILENALTALDNAARCGQMLTDRFINVARSWWLPLWHLNRLVPKIAGIVFGAASVTATSDDGTRSIEGNSLFFVAR